MSRQIGSHGQVGARKYSDWLVTPRSASPTCVAIKPCASSKPASGANTASSAHDGGFASGLRRACHHSTASARNSSGPRLRVSEASSSHAPASAQFLLRRHQKPARKKNRKTESVYTAL